MGYLSAILSTLLAALVFIPRDRRMARGTLLLLCAFAIGGVVYSFYGIHSDESRLLGLPFSDSGGYFTNAIRMWLDQPISTWAGRRPLYTGFLSSLFQLTRGSFEAVLWIQVVLVSAAVYVFYRSLAIHSSRFARAFAVGIVVLFFLRYVGKTLTENLGLTLGLLGWAFLFRWTVSRRPADLMLALFGLSLGLFARAGSFFILPGIALGVILAQELWRKRLRIVGLSAVAVGLAWMVNRAYYWNWVEPGALGFSNFSYTLYGLCAGGKGWTYANEALPHLQKLSDVDRSKFIYEAAIQLILNEPTRFIIGVAKSYFDFFAPRGISAMGFIGNPIPRVGQGVTLFFNILMIRGMWKLWKNEPVKENRWMYRGLILGILASIPWVNPKDADLMRAQAVIIPALAWFAAQGIPGIWKGRVPSHRDFLAPVMLMLVTGLVVAPLFGSPRAASLEAAAQKCPLGARAVVWGPIYLGHPVIDAAELAREKAAFYYPYSFAPMEEWVQSNGFPVQFAYGLDLQTREVFSLILPPDESLPSFAKGQNNRGSCIEPIVAEYPKNEVGIQAYRVKNSVIR